jgi:transposase
MIFYNNTHTHYCGVDLHANTLYLCIIDNLGEIKYHKDIKANPEEFLEAISGFEEGLVVGVESTFCWYWLCDLCHEENIKFILGHALYMKAIHGGKAKSDKIDSHKLAVMLRGGTFPIAYAYPKKLRALRDLMRRRLFLSRKRAELLVHVQMTHQQYNLPNPGAKIKNYNFQKEYQMQLDDPVVHRMVESDLELIHRYTKELKSLESYLMTMVKEFKQSINFEILRTIPGIGSIIGMTLLLEIDDIKRFSTHSKFCSYSRLVKPEKTSAGKRTGSGGRKIGNCHLKWGFSEATAQIICKSDKGKQLKARLLKKHSKAKTMSIISHKLGKTIYYMLLRQEQFDENKFFA